MGNASKALAGLKFGGEFIAQGLGERTCNVIDCHGVIETDVTAEVDVSDLDIDTASANLISSQRGSSP